MSYWGNRKPDFGLRCGIDWGHPLARGLLFRNTMQSMLDSASQTLGVATPTVITKSDGVQIGTGLYSSGSLEYSTINASVDKFAIAVKVNPLYLGNDCEYFAVARGWSARLRNTTTVGLSVGWGTVKEASGSFAIGRPVALSFAYDGASIRFYADGVVLGNVAETRKPSDRSSAPSLSLGNRDGGPLPAIYMDAAFYDRALSAAEVAWLYAEPYAMFLAPEMPVFYSIPAGGSSIAAIRYHYERLRMSA